MPLDWAFAFARRRNTALPGWIYQGCRKWPDRMRAFMLKKTAQRLAGSTDMRHFTASYAPWDQRVYAVPDADLFEAFKSGKASVATDSISGFAGREVLLASGRKLRADILVSATGLDP